ncbi:hypothetical protein GCM10009530_59720 [Microbispora corallina]|uniref:Transmembrane protein n=1 Tax=Microbispora corallina TaxID=83302 RepID=A0ABQ4GAF7_9ACTN|nr:hypothetical protein [Microbispora corallina]GIH43953.1 hypothetical protein Mco01_69530 [Microbispora corallina]
MGSAFLYLAIVVMWLSVLLPMWLRRDRNADDDLVDASSDPDTGTVPEPTDSSVAEADTVVDAPAGDRSKTAEDDPSEEPGEAEPAPSDAPARPRTKAGRRRARILARRRRRLLWSILLVVASVVTAAVRVVPWWAVAPSGVLLVSYLLVLRIAVRMDREQRERAAQARAEHLRRQRERRRALAALAREAEIIQFEARRRAQVFDQYADGRRAVGD